MDADYGSDSDFYGPVDTVCKLRERVRLEETRAPRTPVHHAVAWPVLVKKEEPCEEKPWGGLLEHNPAEQAEPQQQIDSPWPRSYECQPSEAIGDFLLRLPPATTVRDDHTPWIYVCNPSIGRQVRPWAGSQLIPGCGDEGPQAEQSHTLLFVRGARERLDLLKTFLDGIAHMGVPEGAAQRDMECARESAAKDILGLAGHLRVTCGKWMLFIRPSRVNRAWEAVARATHRGDLGIAAKVAPRDSALTLRAEDEAGKVRLICIYTSDFRDLDDVTRVLRRLESMRLVTQQSRGRIYYKCDAYTYLGIGAGNPWGLRASLFSSSDVFTRLGSLRQQEYDVGMA